MRKTKKNEKLQMRNEEKVGFTLDETNFFDDCPTISDYL